MLLASLLVLVLVLLIVFARASIEAGEERVWIFLYLFTIPLFIAIVVAWGLDGFKFHLRLAAGILTLIIVAVVLVQTALFADRIYENPKRFRVVLPAVLRVESLYMAVFPTADDLHARHERKATEWRDVVAKR
jgi:uncharacterized protein